MLVGHIKRHTVAFDMDGYAKTQTPNQFHELFNRKTADFAIDQSRNIRLVEIQKRTSIFLSQFAFANFIREKLHQPGFHDQLRVLGRTEPATPALPFITANGQNAEAIADALDAAIRTMTPADRAATGLRGIVRLPASAYLAVPNPPSPTDLGMTPD